MANNFDDSFAANLVGLWDFLAGSETRDTGLGDGVAQNGTLVGGALAGDGLLSLPGNTSRFDVSGEDAPFDLAHGSLIAEFTQSESGVKFQSVVNRGEFWDAATEGFFEIIVTPEGAVTVNHTAGGTSISESTGPGFFAVGDTLRTTYSWSATEGGSFTVDNLTAGTTTTIPITATGLTMDIGGNDGTSFTFGARENVDDEFLSHFRGQIDYVAIYDDRIDPPPPPPPGSDGIVTNGDDSALIDTGYTGDPDGDVVDGGDSIFPPVGSDDDIIRAGGGDDTVEAGNGNDSVDGGPGNDLIRTDGPGGDTGPDRGFPGVPGVSAIPADTDPGDDRDTVEGGPGDDTIATGDDADLIDGGEGDDSLDGGIDDDTILGGAGDDTIIGGEGNDSVLGGDGDDLIDTSNPLSPLPDRGFPSYDGLPAVPADPVPDNDLDTVFGGAGDDTIVTGDDDDVIFGDDGDDSINAGLDDDFVDGGAGDDFIIGGEGEDTILGGVGADTIYGGLGPGFPDATNIPDDLPGDLADPLPRNGRDVIEGGAGDDLLFGQDDNDTLVGGDGNDTLDGGIDNDDMLGGDDRDVFVNLNQGDIVDGGEGGDDFDTLDLRGAAQNSNPGGGLRVVLDAGNPENGTVFFFDADGNDTGTLEFVNIETIIPCFTPGTMIATPKGERAVETLKVGDRIITRDNGIQTIRWLGTRTLSGAELARASHLRPVLIRKGALGGGLPERDMKVSPNHRVLVSNDKTALYFEESEVLVAAKHLTGLRGVEIVDVPGITYIHFMFDQHEVVLSDGAWTESFQPGDQSLAGIGNAQRLEIFELFPELKTPEGVRGYTAARRSLKKHEAHLVLIDR